MKSVLICITCIAIYFFAASSVPASVLVITTEAGTTAVQSDVSMCVDGPRVMFEGEELVYLAAPGQPALPWRVLTVLVSPETDMSALTLSCEASFEVLSESVFIDPMPPMATRDDDGDEIIQWPSNQVIVDGCDIDIYKQNAYWPSQPAHIQETGSLRGWKLVRVAVALFRYNPIMQSLESLSQISISLMETSKSSVSTAQSQTSSMSVSVDAVGCDRVRALVVNYDQAACGYQSTDSAVSVSTMAASTEVGYLILTTDEVVDNSEVLDDFVDHKESLGFVITIITEDDFGGGTGDTAAANMRSWLQDHYSDFEYLLLIGDPSPDSDLPMKVCAGVEYPSDYFYAELTADWDIDGDDVYGEYSAGEMEKYFELYVGRIPYYGDIDDLDHILQKTIDYETSTELSWRNSALLGMIPLDDSTLNYQLGESVKTLLDTKGYTYDRLYEDYYGIHSVPEYTRYDIFMADLWTQNHYGLIFWNTHGSSEKAGAVMRSSNVDDLDDEYPAVVYQASCKNGYPENSSNLAYRLLKNGAVTTCAATRSGWYSPGQTNFTSSSSQGGLGYKYFEYLLYDAASCGQAFWDAKQELNIWEKNYYTMNLYGDPSITPAAYPDFLVKPTAATHFYHTHGNASSGMVTEKVKVQNTTSTMITWTASCQAQWLDISKQKGTLGTGNSVVSLSLNDAVLDMQPGNYCTDIDFYDETNQVTTTHTVILHIAAERLLCRYEMEEDSGTTAIDSSGNNLCAVIANEEDFSAHSVAGVEGQGFEFDGSDDYIMIRSDTPYLNLYTDTLTMCAWVKCDDTQSYGTGIIFAYGDGKTYGGSGTRSGLRFMNGNTLGYYWDGSTNGQSTSFSVPEDTWTFVALTIEPTKATIYMYDGSDWYVSTMQQDHAVEAFGSKVLIGRDASTSRYFEGTMDDVCIYSYALDKSDIMAMISRSKIDMYQPYNGQQCSTAVQLSWIGLDDALAHQVYFGQDYTEVQTANVSSGCYQGQMTDSFWDPDVSLGQTYYWRVDEVLADGSTVTGDVWQFSTGRGITYELWTGISTKYISSLTNLSSYPDSPAITGELTSLKGYVNWSEYYGLRIHGYLQPKETGYYKFWIASDDSSQLWLSTDASEENAVLRAEIDGSYVTPAYFDETDEQESSYVRLIAGQRYYIKILLAEAAGDDHLLVSWKKLGGQSRSVIGAEYLLPYGGDNSAPVFTDGTKTVKEGIFFSGTLAEYMEDPEGDGVDSTFTKVSGPDWLTIKSSGVFYGTPSDADCGANEVVVAASDGLGASGDATWTIDVQNLFWGDQGMTDMAGLSVCWMQMDCSDCTAGDLDEDGNVDMGDLIMLAENWLGR